MKYLLAITTVASLVMSANANLLIPMDETQTDHLRAYGVAYKVLSMGENVEWLLNYRGGSFMMSDSPQWIAICQDFGVSYEAGVDPEPIYNTIEQNNMEVILLERAPRIAVYTPPIRDLDPWDDAVMLAMDYARIPYDKLYDEEILAGKLAGYDWLHLHHEDFTGQLGKFWMSFRDADWYLANVAFETAACQAAGFPSISEHKKAVARAIKHWVEDGGFMFAMCSATDTLDIALASEGIDIVDAIYDGTPPDANANSKLDYGKCLAFKNFELITSPYIYEYSDIDTPRSLEGNPQDRYLTWSLFAFSAKDDPIPTLLTQDHVSVLKEFMGQTTAFREDKIKSSAVIMGRMDGLDEVKYLYGSYGEGSFTFLAGHDPEDFQHLVGDPPTDLSRFPHSPGYRLILNNILFPAARREDLKT
jgi:hypothetical protein